MKALVLHMVYFRLPDDFSGSIADALRQMADYHEEHSISGQDRQVGKLYTDLDRTLSETFGIIFDEFVDAIQTGKRVVGLVQLRDFDPKVSVKEL